MVSRKLAMVLGLTLTFLLVEVVGGYLSGSLALLADAGHMATDVAALTVALVGARIAQRRSRPSQRFGNLRWEVLAALVNGAMLFVIGAMISVEAIERLGNPREIDAVMFGIVATAGLVVNLIALKVLHGDHSHDLNVRGAYLHILGDVLGSVGAITAAVVIHTTGWLPADPLVSMLISALILVSAWRLIRDASEILLDREPRDVSVLEVERRLTANAGVARVHDVHVWTVTSGLVAMSAHAVVPELARHPETLRQLEGTMREMGIGHVTIQLETGDPCDAEQCGHEDHPLAAHRAAWAGQEPAAP